MGADPYAVIMLKMGYPYSARLRRVIEAMATPDQAQLLTECPGTVDELAQKVKRPKEVVLAELDDLADKSLVWEMRRPDGSREYSLVVAIEGWSDGVMMFNGGRYWDDSTRSFTDKKAEEYSNLLLDFMENDWYRWERTDELVHKRVKLHGGAGRYSVSPAWKALEKSGLEMPESLWFWDARQGAKRAKSIYVAPCACRLRARRCNSPVYTCTFLNVGSPTPWFLERLVREEKSGARKLYSAEQWLKTMGECEEYGMVHIGTPPRSFTCTCCTCCCNIFHPLTLYAKPSEGLDKSPFRAVVNQDVCEGCPDCIAKCRFEAIKVTKDPVSGKRRAFVDVDKCFGCGQCVVQCKVPGAIKLKLLE